MCLALWTLSVALKRCIVHLSDATMLSLQLLFGACRREESVGALREMCRGALRERDAAWQEAAQAERRAAQLERDVGVLGAPLVF